MSAATKRSEDYNSKKNRKKHQKGVALDKLTKSIIRNSITALGKIPLSKRALGVAMLQYASVKIVTVQRGRR